MSDHTIGQDLYLKVAQAFNNWAKAEHYVLWFTGSLERHHRTETILPRLIKKGKLKCTPYHKILVYNVPRLTKGLYEEFQIEHGLGCTEGMVRFWLSNKNVTIVPERKFKFNGIRPEWGMIFPNNKLLLYEFCTRNNATRSDVVKSKITRYQKVLDEKYIVLFVIDLPREKIQTFIDRSHPLGPFLFTDFTTFKSVPIGQQLSSPIYLWGEDGKTYPVEAKHEST
jgi:hypothetical protein